MKIQRSDDGKRLTVELIGEVDSMNANDIEETLLRESEGVTDIMFDLGQLEYISSAGLRVLLAAQKTMNRQGTMKVIHTNEMIREIFEVTGFSDILTVE